MLHLCFWEFLVAVLGAGHVLGVLCEELVCVFSTEHLDVVVGEDTLCGQTLATPVEFNNHVAGQCISTCREALDGLGKLYFRNVACPDSPEVVTVGVLVAPSLTIHVDAWGCLKVVTAVDGAPSHRSTGLAVVGVGLAFHAVQNEGPASWRVGGTIAVVASLG